MKTKGTPNSKKTDPVETYVEPDPEWKVTLDAIDRKKLKDPASHNYRTQSLFLETRYDESTSIYSLKEDDYEFNGTVYPSLKKIYMQMEDVGEYEFATKAFLSWDQWQRIIANKIFTKVVQKWRNELEIMLRGRAIAAISKDVRKGRNTSMSSAKWMADRGWKSVAGRPSKADIDEEKSILASIENDYKSDVVRIHGDRD